MRKVVINAGPLIALSAAGCLDVLEKLYKEVLVPEEVFEEVASSGAGRAGALDVQQASYLKRCTHPGSVELLLVHELGPGEAAVIALAKAESAEMVILDEKKARRIATHVYGLKVKGSAGVLIQAKKAGHLRAIAPCIEKMQSHGYHLGKKLLQRIYEEAKESPTDPT